MTDTPTNTAAAEADFWKRKLLAFLHDPPDKCLDLRRHEEGARQFMSGAGFDAADDLGARLGQIHPADHFASAADRFVFPRGTPHEPKCSTTYSGQPGACFLHPLSSEPWTAAVSPVEQAGHLHEILKDAVGGIDSDDPRTTFFLYWRRWLENAVTTAKQNAALLAFLPGDSRLPDHSIWNHMAVTSAAAGCLEPSAGAVALRPALLLFQLGPVQEFIAQARSTRDLWSGSYLLSWLMAHAMKAVSDRVGPDAIIFPSLRGNGIFDALHRTEMYQHSFRHGDGKDQTCWQRLLDEKRQAGVKGGADPAARWLLTPTLPNRFLALVPAARAAELAAAAAGAIQAELAAIGNAVWAWVEAEARGPAKRPGVENWRARWDAQIEAFPQTSWAIQPWLDRDACLAEFAALPVNQGSRNTPLQRLQDMLDFGEKWLPAADRDERFYRDAAKTTLNNPGVFWSAHYALVDAKLAARRNTRSFAAWSDPSPVANGSPKDSLSGKEESIGDEEFWQHLVDRHPRLFTSTGHRYGAMNLIKRLWCRDDKVPYLRERLGLGSREFASAVRAETVPAIACKNTAGAAGRDGNGDETPRNPYVAVLAMDGDEMGKWLSGEKPRAFLRQVSRNARQYLEPILARYGKADIQRLLTPSYHLQFSEALANYSTWLAAPIVEAFAGQLIYAGGDDVLAMLPADQAIACAEALRAVFRGEPPAEESRFHLAVRQTGYVSGYAGYPLVVPGSAADVSIGLALGHCHAPLQMLVKEAQKAETRAKGTYGRGALAVSLYKRSGEIIEWGCKWDNGAERVALRLLRRVTALSSRDNPPLSGRFPYALAGLLAPYGLERPPAVDRSTLCEIIRREFAHVVDQQGRDLKREERDELLRLADLWLTQSAPRLEDFAKLFLVETFINRQRGEE